MILTKEKLKVMVPVCFPTGSNCSPPLAQSRVVLVGIQRFKVTGLFSALASPVQAKR